MHCNKACGRQGSLRSHSFFQILHMAISKMQSNVIKATAILAFIAIVLVATLELRVQDHIGDILDWIEDHKVAGSISFVGLYALFTGDLLQKTQNMVAATHLSCMFDGQHLTIAHILVTTCKCRSASSSSLCHEPGSRRHIQASTWVPSGLDRGSGGRNRVLHHWQVCLNSSWPVTPLGVASHLKVFHGLSNLKLGSGAPQT